MKKIIYYGFIFILLFLIGISLYVLVVYLKDTYSTNNNSSLYEGFKIIEEKNIAAEDGISFYTIQVKLDNPKTPFRLYVFSSDKKEKRLFFIDSYMYKFNPKVSLIQTIGDSSYYLIETYLINYDKKNYNAIAAGYLKNLRSEDTQFSELVPIVKKLIEDESWFWLYEGSEFLLKSSEKEFALKVLTSFETINKYKKEYSEPYYRSNLTYEKMLEKCQELLKIYGGVE